MIGMSQIKRRFYIGLGIGLGISIIVSAIVITFSVLEVNSYKNGTNKEYNAKYTRDIVVAKQKIVQGEVITADMVSEVNVHINSVPEAAVLSAGSTIGSVAKYNIAINTPLTTNMLTDKITSFDTRLQEINTVLMPSDLYEGDFVDVRIMFSNGTDYIVLAEKQVISIQGQTIWFELTEAERQILNSAVVDSFLNEGTKLYATKYFDSDAQIKIMEESDEIVTSKLKELIKEQIPELLLTLEDYGQPEQGGNADGNVEEPSEGNAEENTDETIEADDNYLVDLQEEINVKNDETVEKVLEFIKKYNNLTAVTTKTEVTYSPNAEVNTAMMNDINVNEEAKNALSEIARINLENLIQGYVKKHEDDIDNVVEGAEKAIEEQKSLRSSLLGEE